MNSQRSVDRNKDCFFHGFISYLQRQYIKFFQGFLRMLLNGTCRCLCIVEIFIIDFYDFALAFRITYCRFSLLQNVLSFRVLKRTVRDWGNSKFSWEEIFYWLVGTWGGVILNWKHHSVNIEHRLKSKLAWSLRTKNMKL